MSLVASYGCAESDSSPSSTDETEEKNCNGENVESIPRGIVLAPELEAELPSVSSSKRPSNDTVRKLQKFLEYRAQGHNFMENLKSKKDFHNPYILDKVVDYFGIKDIDPNFNKRVFDPRRYEPSMYYDQLALIQKRVMHEAHNPPSERRKTSRWN